MLDEYATTPGALRLAGFASETHFFKSWNISYARSVSCACVRRSIGTGLGMLVAAQ